MDHPKKKKKYFINSAANFFNVLHAHIFVRNFGAKNHKAELNKRKGDEKLPKRLAYKKGARKTLMKLTPDRSRYRRRRSIHSKPIDWNCFVGRQRSLGATTSTRRRIRQFVNDKWETC